MIKAPMHELPESLFIENIEERARTYIIHSLSELARPFILALEIINHKNFADFSAKDSKFVEIRHR